MTARCQVQQQFWLHTQEHTSCPDAMLFHLLDLEKKRKDYAFWRQFNEKPSIVPGCPDLHNSNLTSVSRTIVNPW